jgi:hypothetical protein
MSVAGGRGAERGRTEGEVAYLRKEWGKLTNTIGENDPSNNAISKNLLTD